MSRKLFRSSSRPGSLGPDRSVSSPARRGVALAAGFWVVIVVLLGARVALFDEIAAARMAQSVAIQLASLSTILLR